MVSVQDYGKWYIARLRLLDNTLADGREFLCRSPRGMRSSTNQNLTERRVLPEKLTSYDQLMFPQKAFIYLWL